jgi:hypothetical protein
MNDFATSQELPKYWWVENLDDKSFLIQPSFSLDNQKLTPIVH